MRQEQQRAVCNVTEADPRIANGRKSGTGYLISEALVATCQHVVENTPLGGRVDLRFFRGPSVSGKLRDADAAADAAILELDAPVADIEPLALAERYDGRDEWTGFGYPATALGDPLLLTGCVDLPDHTIAGRASIVLQCNEAGDPITGWSGSPVLVGDRVVGHIAHFHRKPDDPSRPVHGKVFAVPIAAVRQLLRPSDLPPPQHRTDPPSISRQRGATDGEEIEDTRAPQERAMLRAYLVAIAHDLDEANRRGLGNVGFLPPDWRDVPRAPSPTGDWGRSLSAHDWRTYVHGRLRALPHMTSGRPGATAQLIAAEHQTRPVRDLMQELERAVEPLVLLGDPGSGKSTALRALGSSLARQFASTGKPRIVVYVQLGHGAASAGETSWNVFSVIRESIRGPHRVIRSMVTRLASEGRLVVLFDGLDELARRAGSDAAEALSTFARDYYGQVKCVFACRTLQFDPRFGQRQILLLPFDRAHVRTYLEGALEEQVCIEGERIARSAVIQRLLDTEDVTSDFLRSPMLLYLACFYILKEEKWPGSRRDIFSRFLADFEGRAAAADAVRRSSPSIRDAWRALAYEMTCAGTTVWAVAQSRSDYPHDDAVVSGLAAGLLLPDGDAESRVRFTHHRFQEYLTAEYIADHPDAIHATVLDEPRWHETLFDLAALRADSPAIAALFKALGPMSSDDPSGTRRAYRIHLAARILGVVGSPDSPAHQHLRPMLEDNLRDVALHGEPPAQVVALWAYAIVSDLPWDIIQDGPLRSEIDWVHEQAHSLALRNDAIRARADDDFAEQLLIDVVRGRLSLRAGAYVRATRRAKRNRALLAWAIACTCMSGVLSLALVWEFCGGAGTTIVSRLLMLQDDSGVQRGLFAAAIVSGTLLWRVARVPLAVAWRASACAVVAIVALGVGAVYNQMRDAVGVVQIATLAAAWSTLCDPLFRVPEVATVWASIHILFRRHTHTRRVLSDVRRDRWMRTALIGIGISGLLLAVGWATEWLPTIASSGSDGWEPPVLSPGGLGSVHDASWPVYVLVLTVAGFYLLTAIRRRFLQTEHAWWPLLLGGGLASIVVSSSDAAGIWSTVLAVACAGMFGFLTYRALAARRWRRSVAAWVRRAKPRDVVKFLEKLPSSQQQFVLSLLTPSLWRRSWADHVQFLRELDSVVDAEPARSTYWAKMHEANEGARQHNEQAPPST